MELFCLDKQKTTRQKIEHFKVKTSLSPIGTLSKDDDNGSENVGKKMNLRSFKVNCVFGPAQYVKMQGTFPEVEFLRILFRFKKRKENSSSYVHVLHKTSN